jgi:regulator of protease activity HflC (stomatin/prohibitin superfamily)
LELSEPHHKISENALIVIAFVGAICFAIFFIGRVAAANPDASVLFQLLTIAGGFVALFAAVFALGAAMRLLYRNRIPAPWQFVPEWRYGLLYRGGRFVRAITEPERVWTWWRSEILYVIKDEQALALERREAISSDRLPFLISATVLFKVTDPYLAIVLSTDYRAAFFAEAAAALLDTVGARPLAQMLDERRHLDTLLHAGISPLAQARWLEVTRVLITELIVHPEILISLEREDGPGEALEPGGMH